MSNTKKPPSPVPEAAKGNKGVFIAMAVLAVAAIVVGIKFMQDAPTAGAGGPGGGAPMEMPPAAVYVVPVMQLNTQAIAKVTGSLRAVSAADVAAQESGAVTEIKVNEGDRISKGDVIARLDDRRIKAQLKEAEAALASAKSMASQRHSELERSKSDIEMKRELLPQKAVSKSDVLDAERTFNVSVAQNEAASDAIEEAKSRIDLLAIQADDLSIRAPFDGIVVQRMVEPGEWVGAGAVVASLVTVDPIEAWLRVPVRHLDDLSKSTTNFRVRRSATGAIIDPTQVDIIPEVEPLSQLFTAVATLPNPKGRLAPGESVTGLVPVGQLAPHWTFPTDAIVRSASGQHVFVVQAPEGGEGLAGAKRVPVTVAFERDNLAFIPVHSVEFQEGDQVIVEGNERLMPGQSLMVKVRGAEEAPTAPPAP